MSSDPSSNPYHISEATIEEPPTRFFEKLKFLGPGFILSASIVGSGELIATTSLGAKAGFVTLWVILVSCLVKVTLQLEFGKHAINTGETTMEAFNKLPGPKLGKANWSIWVWLGLMVLKFLQVGGIIGLVAVICNIALPGSVALFGSESGAETAWTIVFAIIVSLLIFRGKYQLIEKLSIILIGLFTLLTVGSLVMLQSTAYAVSAADVGSGLVFDLPKAAIFFAIGAFGITGVGGDEVMHYNYWLLEKGYAKKTGPRKTDDPDWQRRAKGWINIMYLDAIAAMVVYTLMTMCFYILGAAILHGTGGLPEGAGMVARLSTIYTETLGPKAGVIFLVGAFIVLFSTLFSALGAWTRAFSDSFGVIGWIDFNNVKQRRKTIAWLAWVIPVLWAAVYLFFKAPQYMVMVGGVSTSLMLILVVFAAFHFRYKRLGIELRPSKFYDACLWVSAVAILLVGVWACAKPFIDEPDATAPPLPDPPAVIEEV